MHGTGKGGGLSRKCLPPECQVARYRQVASTEALECGRILRVMKEASASANRAEVATVVPPANGAQGRKANGSLRRPTKRANTQGVPGP